MPVALSVYFSKNYWGYYFVPPKTFFSKKDSASIESIAKFLYKYDKGELEVENIFNSDLLNAHENYSRAPWDFPSSRLYAAIVENKKIPKIINPLSEHEISTLIDEILRLNIFVKDNYGNSEWFSGSVAKGRDSDGNFVVFAALMGNEVSNDHYPLYDLIFSASGSNKYQLTALNIYFEDVAGLEGLRLLRCILIASVVWNGLLIFVIGLFKLLFKLWTLSAKFADNKDSSPQQIL